jgi:hypothetical protein
MLAQHLSYDEFLRIARLCQSVDLGRLPPGFDFRRYLLRILRSGAPGAAPGVDRLTDVQIDALRSELAEFQAVGA